LLELEVPHNVRRYLTVNVGQGVEMDLGLKRGPLPLPTG
jgi:hypothetical protein